MDKVWAAEAAYRSTVSRHEPPLNHDGLERLRRRRADPQPPPRMYRLLLALTLLAAAVGPAAAQETALPPAPEPVADGDLVSALEARGNFTVLLGALEQTGLTETLRSGELYTLFAPTDEAFAALPAGTLEALDADQVAALLRYHTVAGEVDAEEAMKLGQAETLTGSALAIDATGDGLLVNGIPLVETDVRTGNGVIHVLSAVLLPPMNEDYEEDYED